AVGGTDDCVGQVTNIGNGKGISVGELAVLIAEIAGRPDVRIVTDPARIRPENSEVFELVADATVAKERCGWQPKVSLRNGLAQVVDYVRGNLEHFDVDQYTV